MSPQCSNKCLPFCQRQLICPTVTVDREKDIKWIHLREVQAGLSLNLNNQFRVAQRKEVGNHRRRGPGALRGIRTNHPREDGRLEQRDPRCSCHRSAVGTRQRYDQPLIYLLVMKCEPPSKGKCIFTTYQPKCPPGMIHGYREISTRKTSHRKPWVRCRKVGNKGKRHPVGCISLTIITERPNSPILASTDTSFRLFASKHNPPLARVCPVELRRAGVLQGILLQQRL